MDLIGGIMYNDETHICQVINEKNGVHIFGPFEKGSWHSNNQLTNASFISVSEAVRIASILLVRYRGEFVKFSHELAPKIYQVAVMGLSAVFIGDIKKYEDRFNDDKWDMKDLFEEVLKESTKEFRVTENRITEISLAE